ncbi:MAG: response regulator [Hyphomicrobiaceae bacterium]|nr:response regulator [Hyphomicrobiaceae bacterium]
MSVAEYTPVQMRLSAVLDMQNQIASAAMSGWQATRQKMTLFHALGAVAESRALVALAGLLVAFGGMLLVAAGGAAAGGFFLVVLTALAMLGAFLLLALATGHAHIGGRQAETLTAAAIADGLGEAMQLMRLDGTPLWTNAAGQRLLKGSAAGGLTGLEAALGGTAEVSETFYRLMRGAAAGAPCQADLRVDPPSDGLGPRGSVRWVRIVASPVEDTSWSAAELGPLVLWRIFDVTPQVEQQTRSLVGLESMLARFQAIPLGLVATDADGEVTYLNEMSASLLGLGSAAAAGALLRDRAVKLSDLFANDGAELIASATREPGALVDTELDLVREDGLLLPVRVLARGDATAGIVLAVLDLRADPTTDQAKETSSARFSRFFRSAPLGIATLGRDGTIISANAAFSRMLLNGDSGVGTAVGERLVRGLDEDKSQAILAGLTRVTGGRTGVAPIDISSPQKGAATRRIYMSPLSRARGASEAAILYVIDVTEEKQLEAKFAQSQKMEAVGKLAGFVAHDFNNMLTAIIGFSDFLLQTHRPTDPAHADLLNIRSSAARAAGLVAKLLALARQQTLLVEPLQLGELMTDINPLLRRSLSERIAVDISSGRDLWYVRTDKLQLEQAIINLAVNARDAMPEGGRFSISTRNVTERESRRLNHVGMQPGEYVLIEITDTGTGMSKDVLDKIFEPFFTTKAPGKGTGLGLATVYGIVKQTGGFIYPESEPGKGTCFRIYLPRYHLDEKDEAVIIERAEAKKRVEQADLTGSGCVLVVEDEDVVRSFSVRALTRQGYTVLEACDGLEALEIMGAHQARIDLVVSDVVMPGMDGPTMLKEMRKANPDVKIIFVSGYPNEAFQQALGEETFAFLPKPFSLPQLAAKVKEQLGR